MLVTPDSITTVSISEQYSFHGGGFIAEVSYPVISPVPEIVRSLVVFVATYVHVRFFPHVPEVTAFAASSTGSSFATVSSTTAVRTISTDGSSAVSFTVKLPSAVSYPSAAAR